MRRVTIGFTAVVMVLLFASVAGAAPPDPCEKDLNHPLCDEDPPPPPSSTTTTTTTEAPLPACPTGTWTIDGIRRTIYECLWVPVNNGSMVATVTVSGIEGGVRQPPILFVRDEVPGDLCLLEQEWASQNGPVYTAEFDLFYDEIPLPSPSDPDVLDYGAWLGQSYWDFIWHEGTEAGTHWCPPQDPVLWNIREDNNGGSLVLTVSFDPKRGGSLDIALFPENSL